MPKESVNLLLSAIDKVSPVLISIGDKTKALDKETQQLEQSYNELQKANEPFLRKQKELKSALKAQNLVVAEMRKEYKEYGDDMNGLRLQLAVEEQNALKDALKEVGAQINSNRKAFSKYQEAIRKNAVSESSDDEGTTLASPAKGLIAGQVGQMFASAIGGLGESVLTSAIGTPEASLISNTLSSAISGAAMGSIIPGIGTAIGAVVGGASGLISGGTKIFEEKDDAFKEYYAGLYEDVNAATEDTISSGSTIAGSREQTHKAFAKRLGGEEAADEYLERVQSMAASTNYGYDEIAGYSQLLLNTYAPDEVFGVLQSLSDATAGLNLSSSDVEVMISGLSRMRTTGKTTQEYLNYFSERGVDVYAALGDALGVDKSRIAGMVSKGSIKGDVAAEAILDFIDKEYGGLSEDLMNTYDAKLANLEDIMATISAAAGEGYNEMRKSGLDAEKTAYSGELGEAMEEINRITGENKAYLENLSEQYQREALSAVLLGEKTTLFEGEALTALKQIQAEYAEASALYEKTEDRAAALDMERLTEEAEALATAAYESSEQYQTLQDVQLDQIEAIRENTAGLAAVTNAYRLGQELSKGSVAAGLIEPKEQAEEVQKGLAAKGYVLEGYDEDELQTAMETGSLDLYLLNANSHAFGLNRVPYDDYPALLHKDERVLTAAEARAQDAGAGERTIQIIVTGNNFVGTGEEMADQLAEILARKLEEAAVIAVPR